MVLSEKARINNLIVLNEIKMNEAKAKEMAKIVASLGNVKKDIKRGALFALAGKDENIIKAARNIPKLSTIGVDSLNVVDVLKYKYLMMTKEGVDKVKEVFCK